MPPLYSIEALFLHCFGIGLIPWAPGTWASLATLPLLYGLGQTQLPTFFLFPILVILIVGSGFIVNMVQSKHQIKDPSWIVIDEVIGITVGFVCYPRAQWWSLLLLFALFRFLTLLKCGRPLFFDQQIKHGIGVILDDVVAGLYAGVITFFIHTLINF